MGERERVSSRTHWETFTWDSSVTDAPGKSVWPEHRHCLKLWQRERETKASGSNCRPWGNKEMGRNREEGTQSEEKEIRWRKIGKEDREEKQRESTSPLSCVKIEACSLGHLLFSLTFCYLSLICFYLFTSLKSSCLHKLLLPFPRCLTLCFFSSFFSLPPLSLSFHYWLEIWKACSSAPASVNPLPKHLSNARNLEMLKKNHTTTTTTTVLNTGLILARVATSWDVCVFSISSSEQSGWVW